MNKPEPKVPFVITEKNHTGNVCLGLETLPHLVKAIRNADLDDIFLNHREGKSLNHIDLLVNPCYDATEVRAYLEHLLTEAHEAWLVTGDIDTEADTDVTKLQELLTSTEVTLGYYVHTLEKIKAYAKQSSSEDNPVINHIVYTIETALKPRARATAAAPETSDGDADAGSGMEALYED